MTFFLIFVCREKNSVYICSAFLKRERVQRKRKHFGRLAQLVQSIWFTPRGSAVRIRHRPRKKVSKSWPFFVFTRSSILALYYERISEFLLFLSNEIDVLYFIVFKIHALIVLGGKKEAHFLPLIIVMVPSQ